MLDQRLIGHTFTNTSLQKAGTVQFYGILYHYHLMGTAKIGDTLEVVEATPSYLLVQVYEPELNY